MPVASTTSVRAPRHRLRRRTLEGPGWRDRALPGVHVVGPAGSGTGPVLPAPRGSADDVDRHVAGPGAEGP